jgi:acyl carrier protein
MSDALIILFSEVLSVPPEKLNDNTSPDNTRQWDSLAAMHLVAAIEDKFQVRLSTREIMKMSSIGLARKTLLEKNIKLDAAR